MTDLLKLPPWLWLVLAALAFGAVQGYRASAARSDLAALQRRHAEGLAAAEAAARAREAELRTVIDHLNEESTHARQAADRDADTAAAAADGLRQQVARLLASRGATCDAVAAQRRTAAADLLAAVLEDVERAGRKMAADADAAGIAGTACQRAYTAAAGGGRR